MTTTETELNIGKKKRAGPIGGVACGVGRLAQESAQERLKGKNGHNNNDSSSPRAWSPPYQIRYASIL